MTECTQLSDRMPAVAQGRAAWTADEVTHLGACLDCSAEWRLMGRAMRLGEAAAGTLQAGPLATRVLARLHQPERRRSGMRGLLRWAPVALAAGVALSVVTARAPDAGLDRPVAAGEVLPEFLDLSESQLEALLEDVPAGDGTVDIRGFNDLTDEDVSSLLSNLEG